MFAPSREQVRELFFETWRKYREGAPLASLENIALDVLLQHPEYHDAMAHPERFHEREYFPELGETNPFLHMSLHLAIEEQLSIDQPAGVRAGFHALVARKSDRHEALHQALECLAEMVWRAQRDQAAPDASAFLHCIVQRARG